MPKVNALQSVVRFEGFELNLRSGELRRKGGRTVRLSGQPFRILVVLLERPQQIVTREELRQTLWPNDTIVEFEHSISAAMNRLRQALGDSAEKPRYIETLARQGYRWIVPVEREPSVLGRTLSASSVTPVSLIGKRVSHYRVLELLGGGGMGVVYKAEDIKLGRPVALKFLPEELTKDAIALGRFEREARSASALDHPNICAIHEFEEHEGQPFIVMQLLEGQTLRERISVEADRGKTTPLNELLDLAIQISGGLEVAHNKGIIHRDIKPANIFITSRNEAKILDFGLAKLYATAHYTVDGSELNAEYTRASLPDVPTSTIAELDLSKTGVTMGTPCYMSPEQVRGERLDARTDLFSFGAVLYEMATGGQAFPGNRATVVHDAILNHEPIPVLQLNPQLPAELSRIICKMLEKGRELRYQSVAEVRTDLKRLKRETGSAQAVSASPKVALLRTGSRVGRVIVALVMCTIILAALLVWRFKFLEPEPARELNQVQLTDNPREEAIQGGVISPDGNYLAYEDPSGMHIRLLKTGEIQPIARPDTANTNAMWSIASWFPDSARILVNELLPEGNTSMWIVSVLGRTPRKIRDSATGWSVSPDGNRIAFTTGRRLFPGDPQLWVMQLDRGEPVKIFEAGDHSGVERAQWSPSGERLSYIYVRPAGANLQRSLETRDLNGGTHTTILSPPGLHDYYWLPDGDFIFAANSNLWRLTVNSATGIGQGSARKLSDWAGFTVDGLSSTSDSGRLVFQKWSSQRAIYVAELQAGNTKITVPRKLTLTTANNVPTAWTSDSKTVIFASDRNGHWGIYKQNWNSDSAEMILSTDGYPYAHVSPDGKWILYYVQRSNRLKSVDLMRIPVTGGTPQLILTGPILEYRCARAPAMICAFNETSSDAKRLVFRGLDPLSGNTWQLATFDIDPTAAYAWDLSPDGTRIAITKIGSHRIQILTLNGSKRNEIVWSGSSGTGNWSGFDWSSESTGLFVTHQLSYWRTSLYFVSVSGKAHLVWNPKSYLATYGVPSPDGKHIALHADEVDSNFWALENFR
jgi:eukaryotic-like serine/threonine-protein kinase